jgi:hypothetical protein
MNSTTLNASTIVRAVTASAILALTFAVAPTAPAGASTDGQHRQDVCRLAPQYLPRTPDAVEGWLRHCSR